MAKQDTTNKYLLFIVGIVAVVGVVILVSCTPKESLEVTTVYDNITDLMENRRDMVNKEVQVLGIAKIVVDTCTEMACGFEEDAVEGDELPCNYCSGDIYLTHERAGKGTNGIRVYGLECPSREVLVKGEGRKFNITNCDIEDGTTYAVRGILRTQNLHRQIILLNPTHEFIDYIDSEGDIYYLELIEIE